MEMFKCLRIREAFYIQRLVQREIHNQLLMEILLGIGLVIGVGYTSYKIGIQEGASITVDVLSENQIIKFDARGNIVPNKHFDL